MNFLVKRIILLAWLAALSLFAQKSRGSDAPVDKFPEGRMVYPLVRGISCDIGVENDIWVGGKKLEVFMQFDTPQEAQAFHALRYEVGGTPAALNQEGNHKVAPCLYVVGTLSPAEDVGKERQEKMDKLTTSPYVEEWENKSPILHIKYWFITTPFMASKDALVDWIPLQVGVYDHLADVALGMAYFSESSEKHEKLATESGERHELCITENKGDSHLQEGLYPVIGMGADGHLVTLLLAGSDTVPLQCAVQFENEQQAEGFFFRNQQKENRREQTGRFTAGILPYWQVRYGTKNLRCQEVD